MSIDSYFKSCSSRIALVLGLLIYTYITGASAVIADDADRAYAAGDYNKALEIWMLRSYEGDKEAQFKLAVLLSEGKGTEVDPHEAVFWYRRAAEQDHVHAQLNLGHAYLNGFGIATDKKEAVSWWRKAAENGYPVAQYNLGRAYYYGIGVEESPDVARLWFERAAAENEPQSKLFLAKMNEGSGATALSAVAENISAKNNSAGVVSPTSVTDESSPQANRQISQTIDAPVDLATVPDSNSDLLNASTKRVAASPTVTDSNSLNSHTESTVTAQNSTEFSQPVRGEELTTDFGALLDTSITSRRLQRLETQTPVFPTSDRRSNIITTLLPKSLVIIKAEQSGWLNIYVPGGLPVWVYGEYVKRAGESGWITADDVRARSLPSTGPNATPVGSFNKGDRVLVLQQQNDWLRVQAPETISGWIVNRGAQPVQPVSKTHVLEWEARRNRALNTAVFKHKHYNQEVENQEKLAEKKLVQEKLAQVSIDKEIQSQMEQARVQLAKEIAEKRRLAELQLAEEIKSQRQLAQTQLVEQIMAQKRQVQAQLTREILEQKRQAHARLKQELQARKEQASRSQALADNDEPLSTDVSDDTENLTIVDNAAVTIPAPDIETVSVVENVPAETLEVEAQNKNSDQPLGIPFNDNGWMYAQAPNHYTLQLMSSQSESEVVNYIIAKQLGDEARYFPAVQQDGIWFYILYGSYKSETQAAQARARLGYKPNTAMVRNFGVLQKKRCLKRAQLPEDYRISVDATCAGFTFAAPQSAPKPALNQSVITNSSPAESLANVESSNYVTDSSISWSESGAGVKGGVRNDDDTWLFAQNPNYYTIELISTNEEEIARRYIKSRDLTRDAMYFRGTNGGREWFSVVYGSYNSAEDARQEIEALQLPLRSTWIRRIDAVQSVRCSAMDIANDFEKTRLTGFCSDGRSDGNRVANSSGSASVQKQGSGSVKLNVPQVSVSERALMKASPTLVEPVSNADKSGFRFNDNGWLYGQAGDAYTLQLVSTPDENQVLNYLKKHDLQHDANYFSTNSKGQRLYYVLTGVFSNLDEAEQARSVWRVKSISPWIRRFSVLQQNRCKALTQMPTADAASLQPYCSS